MARDTLTVWHRYSLAVLGNPRPTCDCTSNRDTLTVWHRYSVAVLGNPRPTCDCTSYRDTLTVRGGHIVAALGNLRTTSDYTSYSRGYSDRAVWAYRTLINSTLQSAYIPVAGTHIVTVWRLVPNQEC